MSPSRLHWCCHRHVHRCHTLKLFNKVQFYQMGKALSGELFCKLTGLVIEIWQIKILLSAFFFFFCTITLLHSERQLYTILAFLSAVGLRVRIYFGT